MAEEIRIKKKAARRGDDGYKIVSVRMRDELIERLDALSVQTNRSRNELINIRRTERPVPSGTALRPGRGAVPG